MTERSCSGNVEELPATLTYSYWAGTLHDKASRVESVKEGATTLVSYEYQGIAQLVYKYHDEPDVFSSLYALSTGALDNLDRFDRIVSYQWTKDLTVDVDFYDVDYSY